jgi:hypothetical protein
MAGHHRKSLGGERSYDTFERLWQAIIAKVWVVSQGIFFHENARPHIANRTCDWLVIALRLRGSDLALSYFQPFRPFKKCKRGDK